MGNNQRNTDDDYSSSISSHTENSLDKTSSQASDLDSSTKETSLAVVQQSNTDDELVRVQSQTFRKDYYHELNKVANSSSSHSTNTDSSTSESTTTIMRSKQHQKKSSTIYSKTSAQEARPLGICVRKCLECRRFKHILLAECAVCYRMMDLDINDCKCQIFTNKSIIEYFTCSICNSALTLSGYVICANRTCQTSLSALTATETLTEVQEKAILSASVTNIHNHQATHRTVAIQVNTLINTIPSQPILSTVTTTKYETLSSSWWSKRDLTSAITKPHDGLLTYYTSCNTEQDLLFDNARGNSMNAYNSNRPTKLSLKSENKFFKNQSPSVKGNDTIARNSETLIEVPTSPPCLAMISIPRPPVQRSPTVFTIRKEKLCQTHVSCLINADEMVTLNELMDVAIFRTDNRNQLERQVQVDTIEGHFSGLCQTCVEVSHRVEPDLSRTLPNDEIILQALNDRDGQKWTQLVDQLAHDRSDLSSTENAQHLLKTVESFDKSGRLNNLTRGQLQRKIRYAMSRLKYTDESSHIQNDAKIIENDQFTRNSRTNAERDGKIDMLVTVRQLDKHHYCQSLVSPNLHRSPYVDQDHTADETQQFLKKANQNTEQNDDRRLQDLYKYINPNETPLQHRISSAQSLGTMILMPSKVESVKYDNLHSPSIILAMTSNKTLDNPSRATTWTLPSMSTTTELMTKKFSLSFNHEDSTIVDEEKRAEIISPSILLNNNLHELQSMPSADPIVAHPFVRRQILESSQNQSLTSSNSPKQLVETSEKQSENDTSLTSSALVDDTNHDSDMWTKAHDDASPIFSIKDHEEKNTQVHLRRFEKANKNGNINGSNLMSFNPKARSDYQADTINSSTLPSTEQLNREHNLKKYSHDVLRRPFIRLPVTQIEKFDCGTIGPHVHSPSIARGPFNLPSIRDSYNLSSDVYQLSESLTDRVYSLMSSGPNDDGQAFESILNWQQQEQQEHQEQISKTENSKYQQVYVLNASSRSPVRGKQYSIITDEIDMIEDPNACTIMSKWAFADLVNSEREKFIEKSKDNVSKSQKKSALHNNFKICLRKRPLTEFEQNVFKEVDIVSVINSQTLVLHIPSITVDSQVFIKHRIFKCDLAFDEHCQTNTIYHATLAPLLNLAVNHKNCLCLIGGGKYSGKNYLLQSLVDLLAFDLFHLVSTYDIYIKLLGICHNRIIDLLQNYSPIRIMKSANSILFPNDEYCLKTDQDIEYIVNQIKKRRRFIHQLVQINIHSKYQSTRLGSLMIVVLASSQYVYTQNLCSHRRKFLINSLNKTILSLKRALLDFRKNPSRVRAAFNSDVLTRIIQPYVFHEQSHVYFIGAINPGHRHRTATKSTIDFARNLRACLKRINRQRRKREKSSLARNKHE